MSKNSSLVLEIPQNSEYKPPKTQNPFEYSPPEYKPKAYIWDSICIVMVMNEHGQMLLYLLKPIKNAYEPLKAQGLYFGFYGILLLLF